MSLTRDDVKQIAEDVLAVEPGIHRDDHVWTQGKRREEEDIRAMRRRIIESACIWALPLALGWLTLTFWNAIKAAILK